MIKDNLKNKIYCQGVKGAYSHIAVKKIFDIDNPIFVKNFEDVCKNVYNDNNAYGILPFENSNAGIVNGVIHLLIKYDLNIIYAKTIEISHLLCAKKGLKLDNIKKIYSHQQALLQCSNFLSNIKAEQIETVNTAISAKTASEQNNSAAICSQMAAKVYNLEIINKDICNSKTNITRFIIISKKANGQTKTNVNSIYFKLKNKSGELYKVLKIFADYKINLSSLHSLPLQEESWHYGFYVDCEGENDKNFDNCINKLTKETEYLKILGNYISE